ncbi:MAG TPA: hypothetical protein VJM33_08675 [Microthrixaceae bacterium]|nr:hypothetical protein [Microthrixaceae bacterium]
MARRDGQRLKRKDRVVAAVDLSGVPAGTTGRVTMVNGFRWLRYWVYFDNGVDVGQLDRSQLTLVDKKGTPVPIG